MDEKEGMASQPSNSLFSFNCLKKEGKNLRIIVYPDGKKEKEFSSEKIERKDIKFLPIDWTIEKVKQIVSKIIFWS